MFALLPLLVRVIIAFLQIYKVKSNGLFVCEGATAREADQTKKKT